jgi:hypothetical protein
MPGVASEVGPLATVLQAALDPQLIGPVLADALSERLAALDAGTLPELLIAGIAREELREAPAASSSR